MVNNSIIGLLTLLSAHRCDQQSERLLICTHLRITVWVIVPDNPNYAWVRSTLSASSAAPCTLVAAVPECFCHSYTWEWSLTWRHHRFTNPHFTLGCSPLWLFRITSYFPPYRACLSAASKENNEVTRAVGAIIPGVEKLLSLPTPHKDPLRERGTYPFSGSHALQFHLFQVGGSQRHVVIDEVRDQRGRSVVLWWRKA